MTFRTNISRHLTEDELDEAVLGIGFGDQRLHLAGCPYCRARLEQFAATMSVFNQASTAWSEARSNALNRDLKEHSTPLRFSARALWTCASALVVLATVTAGLGVWQHSETLMAAETAQRSIQTERNQTFDANVENEIATDNTMLLQIEAAISVSEPSPQQEYGINTSLERSNNKAHPPQVRN